MNGVPTTISESDDRRKAVLTANAIDGIDYLEVVPAAIPTDPPTLALYFLDDVSGTVFDAGNFAIAGGERITGIAVTGVTHAADVHRLDLTVATEGDFSTYTLVLQESATNAIPKFDQLFDRQLRTVAFHFHLECAARFDCKPIDVCPPAPVPPVAIDYLARDYATFRAAILDRMSLLAPSWTERNPADAGIMLVEAIAYAADRLTYRQDAAGTEAYFGTARLRSSVKRHARLVDYDMHDGCNARTWLHLEVDADVIGTAAAPAVRAHTPFCTTLTGMTTILALGTATYERIEQNDAQVFEAMSDTIALYAAHNTMPMYAWSATECCLEAGATSATLDGAFPQLADGDVLVLAEVKGPDTGDPADADPMRRWAVRLTSATVTADYLNGAPGRPVTDIVWHADDALPFALCIAHTIGSEETATTFTSISGARGNTVLVDHGRTLGDTEVLPESIGTVTAGRRFRPKLSQTYPTFAGADPYAGGTVLTGSATGATSVVPQNATPLSLDIVATLVVQDPLGGPPQIFTQPWTPVRSLLDPAIAASPFAFVPEVESDGTTFLRFGDGVDGALPDANWTFAAQTYRVGQPSLGNVGRETIAHAVGPLAHVTTISNPLAAAGGVDPESIASARVRAPYAFRTQERAVTLDDYATFAEQDASVLSATAEARITRSWRTILITVQMRDGAVLDETTRGDLATLLDLHRMAGLDVEFENATLIPLEIDMHVCVDPSYRRDEVAQAILARFSDGRLPDGSLGVFYPDNFRLAGTVYLSPFYRAAQTIAGVVSVDITRFERSDIPGSAGLTVGFLTPGRAEAFTLRNNPDYPERGIFTLTVDGGR